METNQTEAVVEQTLGGTANLGDVVKKPSKILQFEFTGKGANISKFGS